MVTAVRPFFTYASHERILVAKVREYDYSTACGVCGSLLSLSQAVGAAAVLTRSF